MGSGGPFGKWLDRLTDEAKKELEKAAQKTVDDLLPEPQYVLDGRTISCHLGSASSELKVTNNSNLEIAGKKVASTADHGSENIKPFGTCFKGGKHPCKPDTPRPWELGDRRVGMRGYMLIDEASKLFCTVGGLKIYIPHSNKPLPNDLAEKLLKNRWDSIVKKFGAQGVAYVTDLVFNRLLGPLMVEAAAEMGKDAPPHLKGMPPKTQYFDDRKGAFNDTDDDIERSQSDPGYVVTRQHGHGCISTDRGVLYPDGVVPEDEY